MKHVLLILIAAFILSGCSHTIYERKKSEKDPLDQGSKTELEMRGPRAAVKHSF